MFKKALVLSSVLFAVACSGLVTSQTEGEVVTPSSLKVTVAVSGLSLGDEGCGAASTRAPEPGCGFAGAPSAGEAPGADLAPGCGGTPFCRATGVQLSFKATNEGSKETVEVTRVELLEEDDTELEDLAASAPKKWNDAGYAAWDRSIAPGDDLRTSWTLASPSWSKHGGSYSKRYKVRVTVRVGGEETTVESAPTNREAPVAT